MCSGDLNSKGPIQQVRQQNRQQASRRDTLRWALAGAAGLTLLGSESSVGPKPNPKVSRPAEEGAGLPSTTLEWAVGAGPQRVSGRPYRRLARGPAIERKVREDLCRRAYAGRRTGLAAFGQLTDSHVLDAAIQGGCPSFGSTSIFRTDFRIPGSSGRRTY